MNFAPNHDWSYYDSVASKYATEQDRNRTIDDRFSLYADFFNTITLARQAGADLASLERSRWNEKIALRDKLVAAYLALERMNSEGTASKSAD